MVIKSRTLGVAFLLICLVAAFFMLKEYSKNITMKEVYRETDKNVVATPKELEDEPLTPYKVENGKNFFINYRLERDRLRSQEIDMLREIINNQNTEKSVRESAQRDLLKTVGLIEKEMVIENLIKAKGFKDAVIFFAGDTVNVVVDSENLTGPQVAQISDIVSKGTSVGMDKIIIIEKNKFQG
jgi:stage III sporulation protein AH